METKKILVIAGVVIVLSMIVSLAIKSSLTGNVVDGIVTKSVYEGRTIKFTLNENKHTIYVKSASSKTKKVTFSIDDSEIIMADAGSIINYKNLRVNISEVNIIGYRGLDSTIFVITDLGNYQGVWKMIERSKPTDVVNIQDDSFAETTGIEQCKDSGICLFGYYGAVSKEGNFLGTLVNCEKKIKLGIISSNEIRGNLQYFCSE